MNRELCYHPGLAVRSSAEDPLTDAERGALSAFVFLNLTGEHQFTTQRISELIGVSRRTVAAEISSMRQQLTPAMNVDRVSRDDSPDARDQQRPEVGRPKKLDAGSIAHVLFAVERDRELDAASLARLLRDQHGVSVSSATITRCLEPYFDRIAGIQRTQLTREHRHNRLLFATKFLMNTQRHRVLYTDECYIKQKHGVRWRWVHKDRAGDPGRFASVRCSKDSLLLWGGLRLDVGATELCIISSDAEGNHIVDARKYISILSQYLVPFLDAHGDTVFQQDNARPHVAEHLRPEHGVPQFLYDLNCRRAGANLPPIQQLLHWPPYSPDLSPIEFAWAALKALVRHHVPSDATLPQVRLILPTLWSVATAHACRRAFAIKQEQNLQHCVTSNGANDY